MNRSMYIMVRVWTVDADPAINRIINGRIVCADTVDAIKPHKYN